jgi:tetratricopeptide (TPR) repeat protein
MARKWSVFQFRIPPFLKGIYRSLHRRIGQFFLCVCLGWCLSFQILPAMGQMPISESELIQLQIESQSDFSQGKYEQSAQKLEKIITTLTASGVSERVNLAIAWTNLGNVQLAGGNPEIAIKSWGKAIAIYQSLNERKPISNLLVSQAQGWKKLGLNLQACSAISQSLKFDPNYCQSLTITESSIGKLMSDRPNIEDATYFTAWRLLADVLQNLGRLPEAQIILEQVAKTARDNNLRLNSIVFLGAAKLKKYPKNCKIVFTSPPLKLIKKLLLKVKI